MDPSLMLTSYAVNKDYVFEVTLLYWFELAVHSSFCVCTKCSDVLYWSILTINHHAELDAPTNVLAQDETETSFRVSWDHTQAAIDGYVLTYSSSEGSSEEIPVGSDSSSYRLTGLRPGVLYTAHIWANKGSKSSSKISTQAETGLKSMISVHIQSS